MGVRSLLSKIGTVVVVLAVLGVGALVAWNVFGQGPYADHCSYSLGCRSFYCVKHELRGERQWAAPQGMCTKSCDHDDECGCGCALRALSERQPRRPAAVRQARQSVPARAPARSRRPPLIEFSGGSALRLRDGRLRARREAARSRSRATARSRRSTSRRASP